MNELRCLRAIDRRDLTLIRQLIESGHEFNRGVGQCRMPPVIFYAVQKEFTEAVRLLVTAGVNVNVKYSPELKTPLYMSAHIGSQEITDILCRSGAQVNEVTLKGETPLFAAIEYTAQSGDSSVVRTLISFGANLNTISIAGQTPLTKAIELSSLTAIKILVESGAHIDMIGHRELKCCLKRNNSSVIDYLLSYYRIHFNDQFLTQTESVVDLCLEYLNLKAMKTSIEFGFKASNRLFKNPLILLKTIVPNYHKDFEDAKYCFDYLLTFEDRLDLNRTFAFKCETPNSARIIAGNLLAYSLLFNCSYMSKRLIQMAVPVDASLFDYYRFDHNDVDSLELLHWCGVRLAPRFATKCYPNSNNTEDIAINKLRFKEFCQWLDCHSSEPYRLSQVVRIWFRNRFGRTIGSVVRALDLPNSLKDFLLLEFNS